MLVQAGFFVSEGGVRMPSYDTKRLADADRRVASAHVTLPALTRRMCRHVRDNLGPVIALIPSNYNRLEVCVFVVHLATTAALEHFTR